MSAMKRRLFNVPAAASLVVCITFAALWAASYLSGHWLALRRANVTYNVISDRGWLMLQRAHVQYPPAVRGWYWSHGECMLMGQYGPISRSSLFEEVGLVDALIQIPWDVDPRDGPSAVASSSQATGRHISIPSLAIVALTAFPPMRLVRRRREAKRRGFDVKADE
jgi:hypothetical protein